MERYERQSAREGRRLASFGNTEIDGTRNGGEAEEGRREHGEKGVSRATERGEQWEIGEERNRGAGRDEDGRREESAREK